MFILGYHFPATMGNTIPDAAVIEKLDATVGGVMPTIIKLTYGKAFDKALEVTNMDTFLAKALVGYYKTYDADATGAKYLVYTNKYQISEIAKRTDKDAQTLGVCKLFDGMEPVKVELVA